MNNPLISIAMATYNGEKFLKKQLDSIYNQSYKNIELVVCDDCSNDNTVKILEEYALKHTNMKIYVNDKNLGYIKNFEKVISLCSGEYIAISDQDDIWMSDKIEFLYNQIENNNVICSKENSINEFDEQIKEEDAYLNRFESACNLNYSPEYFLQIYYCNILAGCTSLAKTDFLKRIIPFPEEFTYDHWICLNSFCEKSLKFADRYTLYHRKHSKNISNGKNKKIESLRQKKYKNFQKQVIEKRIDLTEEYKQILDEYYDAAYKINIFKLLKYKKILKMNNKRFILKILNLYIRKYLKKEI